MRVDFMSGYQVYVTGEEHLRWSDTVEQLIERAALLVLETEEASPCEVSVFLTDNEGIQGLNRQYRSLDEPTDVLSFQLDMEEHEAPEGALALLGDVIISLERAQEQALEYEHVLEREVAFLVVHGVLHLLGYDHETESERALMREREESILADLGLTRNL